MKFKFIFFLLSISCSIYGVQTIEKWDFFEISLKGPTEGNPYKEVQLTAIFEHSEDTIQVSGFYDGEGIYKIRFMPEKEGIWEYTTSSSHKKLDNKKGRFTCVKNTKNNSGPVRVANKYHFAYADGQPYKPFGTTCYVWTHQGDELEELTLETLSTSPFNKIRMCLFPKRYSYNDNNPEFYVFPGDSKDNFDFERFNPDYWSHLEKRLLQLRELGIEADLILFHPYDNGAWGFDRMPDEVDDFYLKYVISRLSAFRNIWWSMSNEFHLLEEKTMEDWDRFAGILTKNDPYRHLLSNHNHSWFQFDWSRDYLTHIGIQHNDQVFVGTLVQKFQKPVINDECQYEGDLMYFWGNISAREMVHRYWLGAVQGIYTSHGETYLDPEDILWWSKGGVLKGESPDRIGFLRDILEDGPQDGLNAYTPEWYYTNIAAGHIENYLLMYFGVSQPSHWEFDFPGNNKYSVELIDPWNMTIESLGTFTGNASVTLPGDPYLALRVKKIQ